MNLIKTHMVYKTYGPPKNLVLETAAVQSLKKDGSTLECNLENLFEFQVRELRDHLA